MSHYRRGADFERVTRLALMEEGWTVTRSAGSKGPWDLVGVRSEGVLNVEVILVQCKSKKSGATALSARRKLAPYVSHAGPFGFVCWPGKHQEPTFRAVYGDESMSDEEWHVSEL